MRHILFTLYCAGAYLACVLFYFALAQAEPWAPMYGKTVSISATDVSSSTQVSYPAGYIGDTRVVITNESTTDIAFCKVSDTAPTATTADYPILPGSKEVISFGPTPVYVGCIMRAGKTATILITPGYGE